MNWNEAILKWRAAAVHWSEGFSGGWYVLGYHWRWTPATGTYLLGRTAATHCNPLLDRLLIAKTGAVPALIGTP